MTDPAERAAAFLETLAKLPPFTGIVFHGVPGIPDLATARWTRGVTATSRDPRIATENFRTNAIAAIVSRTGRDIAPYSTHPQENEVVLPPSVALQEVGRTTTDDGFPVVVIEQLAEIDPNAGLPPTLDGLLARVAELLRHARSLPPVPVTTPGKFVEPLFFADESGRGPR